jgi:hypothetical protein
MPIPFLYPKRIKNQGCVSIILILIRHVKKIPPGYPRCVLIIIILIRHGGLLSFLDCYPRYHQIPLKEEDQI